MKQEKVILFSANGILTLWNLKFGLVVIVMTVQCANTGKKSMATRCALLSRGNHELQMVVSKSLFLHHV